MLTFGGIAFLCGLLTPALGRFPTDAVLRVNKGVLSNGKLNCVPS